MKFLQLFQIHRWDGGERQIPHGECAETRETAHEIADKHDAVVPLNLRIYESVQDFKDNQKGEIAKRARAKLTPEELHALGIL